MNWNPEPEMPRRPQKSLDEVMQEIFKNPEGIIKAVLLVLCVSLAVTSVYTVQPEEEAVVLRFGRYHGTYGPGLNFKLPFGIDSLIKVKSKAVLQESFGFYSDSQGDQQATNYMVAGGRQPTSSIPSRNLKEESLMLTGDLNVADVQWVVHYRIADPRKFLFNVRDTRRNIRDISQASMRRVVGDRTVNEVLTVGREEIANEGKILLQQILDQYEMGVEILLVKLQDVNPPEPVQPSFNDVNAAKQEQEQVINRAEANYNKLIPEARGRAEEEISNARGYASALLNRAAGDAAKFSKLLEQYSKAPEITRTRLYIEMMEDLFSRFDNVTVVDPGVQGVLPIFSNALGKVKVNATAEEEALKDKVSRP